MHSNPRYLPQTFGDIVKTALITAGTAFALALSVLIVGMTAATVPCGTEDSNMCFWDASVQGNGQGDSFVVIFDHPFIVTPLTDPS